MTSHIGPIGPTNYGFKMVDSDNLLEPDPLMLQLATIENGIPRQMSPHDLLIPLLRIVLDDPVPHEVRRAFYFARNAMCYAYWYYPLITIGSQQVLRVADYASEVAAKVHGLKPKWKFSNRIAQLVSAGVLAHEHTERWNLICRMRNRSTHPEWQQTWGIPQTIGVVRMVAEEIDALRWEKALP